MDKKILDFLNKERVCALTVILPDGTPHSAAMHFSMKESPFSLIFSTDRTSRKGGGLSESNPTKAAVLVGLSETDWISFQVAGEIKQILGEEEIKRAKDIHYSKIPGSKRFENEPGTVFLEFVPTWWRYTDFNSKPSTTISSEDK